MNTIDSSSLLNSVLNTNTKTQGLDNTLSKDLKNADDVQLMDACKQFEAYFVEQMFTQMQNSIPKSDLVKTSETENYFKGMQTQEYAKMATQGEGVGIAKVLYEQMKRY